MSIKKLRVGIIGMGSMGRNHFRVLNEIEAVSVVGFYDTQKTLTESNLTVHFTSLDALLEQGLDYCVIACPTKDHESTARTCFDQGISFLIEKPLTVDYASAIRLFELQRETNIVTGVGHLERFNPALLEAKKIINHGDIGDIVHISTKRMSPYPARIKDVGVTLDLASHDIDLTRWILGTEYWNISAKFLKNKNDLDAIVAIQAVTTEGALIENTASWLSPIKERQVKIYGTHGTIFVDTLGIEINIFSKSSKTIQFGPINHLQGPNSYDMSKPSIEKSEPLLLQHLSFLAKLKSEPSDVATIEDGVKVLEVIQKSQAHEKDSY